MTAVATNNFVSLRDKKDNPLHHNLTELNAAESVDRGFMAHTDWMAHAMRYLRVRDHLAKHMGKPHTLLDVGCGTLQLEYFLYRNRLPAIDACVAIDLRAQEKWLAEYQWKTPLTLVQMDFVQDDLTEVSDNVCNLITDGFDTVVCTEALEHIPRKLVPTLLSRMRGWVKRSGTVYLSTPNREWGSADTIADNHVGPDGEIREWWYDDLYREIVASGFDVVDAAGTFMKTRRVPDATTAEEAAIVRTLKQRLPYALYSCAISALYPKQATNVMWTLKPRVTVKEGK